MSDGLPYRPMDRDDRRFQEWEDTMERCLKLVLASRRRIRRWDDGEDVHWHHSIPLESVSSSGSGKTSVGRYTSTVALHVGFFMQHAGLIVHHDRAPVPRDKLALL